MPVTTTQIHRITTIHGAARTESRSLAACPRRDRAVEIDDCLHCPHLRSFGGGGPGVEHLLCATDEEQPPLAAAAGTVGSMMERDVICVRPDVSIESTIAILDHKKIGALPVVDDDGHVIGIASKTDLVHVLAQGQMRERLDSFDEEPPPRTVHTARDVMKPIALTLHEGDLVSDAAERLRRSHVHHAPVLSADGRIVGIVTTMDLLTALTVAPRELED